MKIKLTANLLEKIPGITAGVIILKNVQNKRKSHFVAQLLRGICAQKKKELKLEKNKEKVIQALSHTKIDNQILPETQLLESHLNKIIKEKDLESKNNLVDLINYLSLKHLVPVHARDLDEVEKDLEIDFIVPKRGKKAEDINLGNQTANLVLWLIDSGYKSKEDFKKLPREFAKTIQKYCQGEDVEIHFLDCEVSSIDLNYISEKEKLYQEAQYQKAIEDANREAILKSDQPPFLEDTSIPQGPLLKDQLAQILTDTVNKMMQEEQPADQPGIVQKAEIEVPNESNHGDYSSNVALKLGKRLAKSPRQLAEEIIAALPKFEFIEKIEIAGPGFINFHLSSKHLQQELDKIIKQKSSFGRLNIGQNQKLLVEYSSPNIAKPLGAHHLLTTIIGQVLADLLKFAGYDVVKLNWLGDWGTQFGKLIYAYKQWGDAEIVKKDPLNELLKLYVKFHQQEEIDPSLEDKGREEFKKLEEGDEESMKLWQWIKDLSIEAVEKIYNQLGVKFDEYLGEQMYLNSAKNLIEEGKQRGIIIEGEKGALIVPFEDEKMPPLMMQKADGTTLYASRDLASEKDRMERFKPAKCIHVVDVAQSLHFKQLFETVRKFGFVEKNEDGTEGTELIHISFGRMNLPEGKMSTRRGEIIILEEMIKEAVERSSKMITEKSHDLTQLEQESIAEKMAVSAIKYNIISQNRETNMTFDWDKILSLEGNSGPYLQYACARALSILRKFKELHNLTSVQKNTVTKSAAQTALNKLNKKAAALIKSKSQNQVSLFSMDEDSTVISETAVSTATEVTVEAGTVPAQSQEEGNAQPFGHPAEQALLHLLPGFPEAIEQAVKQYKPNLLCNYLFELARTFNSFYNEVHVLTAPTEELKISRIKLVEAVTIVLKNGLQLLGISVFEKM